MGESCKTFATEEECLMLTNDDGEPRCYFEPLGEYEDCETVWPTTTTTTEEIGCCYSGDSYKANDKCGKATDRARCEDMGCSFLVTDDPKDCEMGTTESPTTTEEGGCCYGEGVKENEMCGNKEGRDQCERSGKCEFRRGADADCTYYPPTSSTTTTEPGCCYGDTAKTNEMCAEKIGRDQCERSGKCEFRSGYGADCELPTTTSEPWLGEKDEAVLFGEQGTTLSEAMNTQISLSTLLLLAHLNDFPLPSFVRQFEFSIVNLYALFFLCFLLLLIVLFVCALCVRLCLYVFVSSNHWLVLSALLCRTARPVICSFCITLEK